MVRRYNHRHRFTLCVRESVRSWLKSKSLYTPHIRALRGVSCNGFSCICEVLYVQWKGIWDWKAELFMPVLTTGRRSSLYFIFVETQTLRECAPAKQ